MEARVIGLRSTGKSTLLGALGNGRVEGEVASVKMEDPRVRALSGIFRPKKTTFVEFTVREVPWPQATARKGEMERYLSAVAGGDVFLHVLRAFANPLLGEPPDPPRDLASLDSEFLVADLLKVERALERGAKQQLPDMARSTLLQARDFLEAEQPLRMLMPQMSPQQLEFLRGYQFLTTIPQLLIVNTATDAQVAPEVEAALRTVAPDRTVVAFPFPEALEVAQLSPEEQSEFADALGLPGPANELVSQAAFKEMGLISFLTVGEDEVRGWPIHRGWTARQAGSAIHSDIERGFIRAEVVSYDDFMQRPKMKDLREAGKVRVEGKDYVVQDGDIINFRFNV